MAVMKDPDFVAETTKLNIEIDPVCGEAMQKIVEKRAGNAQAGRRTRQAG